MLQAKSRKKMFTKVESIKDISIKTMFAEQDVLTTLKDLNLVKYYKGQHNLQDRATLNRVVKSKYRSSFGCTFQAHLLNI